MSRDEQFTFHSLINEETNLPTDILTLEYWIKILNIFYPVFYFLSVEIKITASVLS